MKTKLFSILASAALFAAGFTSCSDSWEPDVTKNAGSGVGKLRTSTLGVEVTNGEKLIRDGVAPDLKKSLSRETIDLSNYIVTVTERGSENPVETWKLSEMPELPIFAVGDYSVHVASAESPEAAGWNCPYFIGSQDFSIAANKVTDVETIVCTLENIRVTVVFKQSLLNAAGDDLKVVVTSEAGNSLTFTADTPATDAGYFASTEDENQTLKVTFSGTVNGVQENFAKALLDVKKGQHRRIVFGLTINDALSPEEMGVVTVEGSPISVDTSVIEEDLTTVNNDIEEDLLDSSDRPGHEVLPEDPKPENPDDPKPNDAITFTSSTINLEGGVNSIEEFTSESKEAVVLISAEAGLANLIVTIDASPAFIAALKDFGLDKPFDLAHPGDLAESLAGLNLPVNEQVLNQKSVTFDITSFVPMLGIYPGRSTFSVKAVDNNGVEKSTSMIFE